MFQWTALINVSFIFEVQKRSVSNASGKAGIAGFGGKLPLILSKFNGHLLKLQGILR